MKSQTYIIPVLACLTLIACGNNGSTTNSEPEKARVKNNAEQNKYVSPLPDDAPSYSVATFEFIPYKFKDEYGSHIGYDVDILHAISESEGIKFNITQVPYSELLSSLQEKKYDLAISGLILTEERQVIMEASTPYANNRIGYMVKSDSEYKTPETIANTRIAVMPDSPPHKILSNQGISEDSFVFVDSMFLTFQSIFTGKADSASGVEASMLFNAGQFDQPVEFIPFTDTLSVVAYAPKGETELLNIFNEGLVKIKQNGKYQELNEKWFGENAQTMMVK